MNKGYLDILKKKESKGEIISQTHPVLPLTIWNYSIDTQYSQNWTSVTRQCRGLITEDTTGRIVARPFQKFFNLGEERHRYSDEHLIYEKMDGSLGIAFHYEGVWYLASRGSFTSDQSQKGTKLLYNYGVSDLDPDYTYMFEIIYPDNRIVVEYGEDRLVMIGKRHTENGSYSDLDKYRKLGWDVVKEYKDLSFEELSDLEWDNKEGFVVRFIFENDIDDFVKIKFDEYVRLHKIMTEVSTKSVWEMLRDGRDVDKVLKDVPDEFYDKIREYEQNLQARYMWEDRLYKYVYRQAENLGYTNDRKKFADFAKKWEQPAILFKMLDGQDYEHLIWNLIRPEYKPL